MDSYVIEDPELRGLAHDLMDYADKLYRAVENCMDIAFDAVRYIEDFSEEIGASDIPYMVESDLDGDYIYTADIFDAFDSAPGKLYNTIGNIFDDVKRNINLD